MPHNATQSDPPLSPRKTLPTMYDLPSENPEEPGLPDQFHLWQPQLLESTFKPGNHPPERVFTGSDLNLYYDVNHLLWYKRPDWFGVVGVTSLYENQDLRLSYVIWQEVIRPTIAVELLSPGTEKEDLGQTTNQSDQPPTKWQVYEQVLGIPYYFVFSRYTNEVQAFRLVGARYERWEGRQGRWAIPELELCLGLWQGAYKGLNRLWLRWFTLEGALIQEPTEIANTATQQVAEAQEKAEKLAAKLQELGIDPESL
ncbi:MAG: Uma2 family endonuclease [Spirulinaceae cyanobacterium]